MHKPRILCTLAALLILCAALAQPGIRAAWKRRRIWRKRAWAL